LDVDESADHLEVVVPQLSVEVVVVVSDYSFQNPDVELIFEAVSSREIQVVVVADQIEEVDD
jgi:hypothetical protein